jgi:hypothetical protein
LPSETDLSSQAEGSEHMNITKATV